MSILIRQIQAGERPAQLYWPQRKSVPMQLKIQFIYTVFKSTAGGFRGGEEKVRQTVKRRNSLHVYSQPKGLHCPV